MTAQAIDTHTVEQRARTAPRPVGAALGCAAARSGEPL
jgi:hypothetical protein